MGLLKNQVNLPPQRAGSPISARALNDIHDYLNRHSQDLPDSGYREPWQVDKLQAGQITTSPILNGISFSDFTDCRYWVRPMVSRPGVNDNQTSKLHPVPDRFYGLPGIVIATNIGELAANTHSSFKDGDFVVLTVIQDVGLSATYPVFRCIIISGGGGAGDPSIGQYQEQVRKMVADDQPGWGFSRFHALIPNL